MEFIQYEVNGVVVEIILNCFDVYYVLNEQMLFELKLVVEKVVVSEVFIVFLRGIGKGFLVGGDIWMMILEYDFD